MSFKQGVMNSDAQLDSLTMQTAGASQITRMYVIKQTLTPAAVGANTTAEQTFTVNGLRVGDSIDINKASHQAGLSIGNVRVSANNTLAIQYVNTTAGSITPTSEQYIIGGMA
ncbi:hypothetical protein [Ralstonia mannitolilytica]|uniref:hypothetical protein n=1 Tax=Ralstonia mannitolilytica TaxID=105219 RepID=UPI0009ECFADE|nr:hypothetical protein [Ralstonia mannitolilytica]